KAIKRLNLQSAPGHDHVPNTVISKIHSTRPEILEDLFNASIKQSHYPRHWKHAVCILIPKPGRDPSTIKAYRPISLLSNIGKLLERILYHKRSMDAIECAAIDKTHYGGVPNPSTVDALLTLLTPCSDAPAQRAKEISKGKFSAPRP